MSIRPAATDSSAQAAGAHVDRVVEERAPQAPARARACSAPLSNACRRAPRRSSSRPRRRGPGVGAPRRAREAVDVEALRGGGGAQLEELARVDVSRLAPRDERDAVGGDADARAAVALAGGGRGVDVEAALQRCERGAGAVDAAAARTSPPPVQVTYPTPLIDRSIAGRSAGDGPGDRRRAAPALPGGAHDGVELAPLTNATAMRASSVTATAGAEDGVIRPFVEPLGRLPDDAVDQPRREDVLEPAVALEVDDRSGAVAGDVEVAEADDLVAAVDRVAGEEGRGRTGRRAAATSMARRA